MARRKPGAWKFWKETQGHVEKTGLRELLWFLALWAVGVGAILIVGTLIKLVLRTD